MSTSNPMELAAEVLAAFVSNNALTVGELPALFEQLHGTLQALAEAREIVPAVMAARAPAVSIRKSITPDYLICLEDGKRFKSMRRHLSSLGMTPEQYREKWNLPSTYPMVAPNYAAQRSAMAKSIGLGQMRANPVAEPPASVRPIEVVAPAPISVAERQPVIEPPITAETIEKAAPTPAGGAKRKAKVKPKSDAAAVAPVKRKPGRPRNATA